MVDLLRFYTSYRMMDKNVNIDTNTLIYYIYAYIWIYEWGFHNCEIGFHN